MLGVRTLRRMPTAKCPFNEYELGERYSAKLHELAWLRGRSARAQTLHLVQWALERACAGDDVELDHDTLSKLASDRLTEVA